MPVNVSPPASPGLSPSAPAPLVEGPDKPDAFGSTRSHPREGPAPRSTPRATTSAGRVSLNRLLMAASVLPALGARIAHAAQLARWPALPAAPDARFQLTLGMMKGYDGETSMPLLGSGRVWYMNAEERASAVVTFKDGIGLDHLGVPLDTHSWLHTLGIAPKPVLWVQTEDGTFYSARANTTPRGELRHSSFLQADALVPHGKRVVAAGEWEFRAGKMTMRNRKSGHFEPTEDHDAQARQNLADLGVSGYREETLAEADSRVASARRIFIAWSFTLGVAAVATLASLPTAYEFIRGRRVPQELRPLTEVIAALSSDFTPELGAAVLDLPREKVDEQLARLEKIGYPIAQFDARHGRTLESMPFDEPGALFDPMSDLKDAAHRIDRLAPPVRNQLIAAASRGRFDLGEGTGTGIGRMLVRQKLIQADGQFVDEAVRRMLLPATAKPLETPDEAKAEAAPALDASPELAPLARRFQQLDPTTRNIAMAMKQAGGSLTNAEIRGMGVAHAPVVYRRALGRSGLVMENGRLNGLAQQVIPDAEG